MTTFCLIHGKWHDSTCWVPLVGLLEGEGQRCITPDVPFGDHLASHSERAAPAINALRNIEEPVVVVGHSLAAGIAPLVALGAGASKLIYLCPAPSGPFAGVDVGVSPIQDGFPFPPADSDGVSTWDPDAAIAAMYPRLPADTARALAARLLPGANNPDPFPLEDPIAIPSALVAAREDEFFVPEWSRRIASTVLGSEAVEIDSGHFPMIETPKDLSSLLVEIAGLPPAR